MPIKLPELRMTLPLLLLAPLAACGGDGDAGNVANVATPQVAKPTMLGNVDLDKPVRASGASPFWALEIAPGRITYADFEGVGGSVTDFYPVTPKLDGDHATLSTQNPAGDKVTITLTNRACKEKGAPPVTDPLTAELQIGDRHFTGCARPKPAGEIGTAPGNGSDDATGNASGN